MVLSCFGSGLATEESFSAFRSLGWCSPLGPGVVWCPGSPVRSRWFRGPVVPGGTSPPDWSSLVRHRTTDSCYASLDMMMTDGLSMTSDELMADDGP